MLSASVQQTPKASSSCPPTILPGVAQAALLSAALTLGLAGCADERAGLTVGELQFPSEEVQTLPPNQLDRLARIGAVGLAVRNGEILHLGEPLLGLRRREALVERLRDELILEWEGVDEEVLEAQYLARPEWELEVRHLVILAERWRPDEERDDARTRAEEARSRALAGEPFPELAGEISEEPGAEARGGLLEPGREGTWVSAFWEAALALEEGELSPVVETEYGFHVLQLEARREVPFAEARERVVSEVSAMIGGRTRWEAWLDDQRGTIQLELDEELGLPDSPDVVLARWDGGELTGGEFREVLPALRADTVRRIHDGDAVTVTTAVLDAALTARLLQDARSRNLELPAATVSRIEREWTRTVDGWAAIFRFEPDLSLDQLRERAMEGLTRTGQNVGLVRDEVDRRGPTLDQAYPIRQPGEG
jgi:hypothetical protein